MSSEKVPAKFSDLCSVRADRLRIGRLDLGRSREGKFKHPGMFLLHPVDSMLTTCASRQTLPCAQLVPIDLMGLGGQGLVKFTCLLRLVPTEVAEIV